MPMQTFDGVGGEEGDVSGLKWIVAGELTAATLRLRLARQ